MFNAPIPGMSLTTEPKGRPWENPPQYDDVDDVVSQDITPAQAFDLMTKYPLIQS